MRIALIDADYISYIVCYNKKDEEEKDVFKVLQQTDSYIYNLLKEVKATYYIGALTIGKCFRYVLNLDYKANRKDFMPMKYSKVVKEYMKDNWGFISHSDLEADDIVNICNKIDFSPWVEEKYPDKIREAKSFIISPDKDILSLEGKNYNPNKKEWINISSEEAKYKFWTSMIVGDASDNIKGIPGIGVKGAEKIMYDSVFPAARIIKYYIEHFGEELGINEYTKNYNCLKIKDNWHSFKVPNPIRFDIDKSESKEKSNTKEEVKE